MRIVVNDFAASVGGAISILVSFYNYLISSGDRNEWFFLLSEKYVEETENIHIVLLSKEKNSRVERLLFDYLYGRRIIERIKPDAVFYLQNTFIHGIEVPQIVYMDQSIPFQKTCSFSFFKKEERPYAIYQHIIGKMIKKTCRVADCIIVQTNWMKAAISKQCHVLDRKINVIPPEISISRPSEEDTSVFEKTKFFYPAGEMIYKNHRCIVEALKLITMEIEVSFTISPKDKYKGDKRIRCIGSLSHEEVIKRLSHQTLVFPSYIETYGLPLAEARQLGTIVLAADTEFAREVLYGYPNAFFFDPFNPRELSSLMMRVAEGSIIPKQTDMNMTTKEKGWSKVVECILEFGRN